MMNINGIRIDVPNGANISVTNGVVYVNGEKYNHKELEGKQVANIIIEGDVGNIKCNGSVTCRNVQGYVDCGGSCHCYDVGSYVDAGGSVNCVHIGGDVDAGGSVITNSRN